MTRTAAELRALAAPHARARLVAAGLVWFGVALGSAALGILGAPRPATVVLAWIGVVAGAVGAVWLARRGQQRLRGPSLARLVEQAAQARDGSVTGPAAAPARHTSAELWEAADARAAEVVTRVTPAVHGALQPGTRGRLAFGGAFALVGAIAFVAAEPGSGRAAAFWHPLRTLRDASAPVRVSVDRAAVRRGETVTALVEVPSATRATLWTRGAGETWQPQLLTLDSAGQARVTLGPLHADLFVRAASGARRSPDLQVTVLAPAFLADLALTARFPSYIGRGDEPLVAGPDTITLPAGTVIVTRGSASIPLAGAAWISPKGAPARLTTTEQRFEGRFTPGNSGTWNLSLTPEGQDSLVDAPPALVLRLVSDSAPVVAVPVPGRDTTLSVALRQPLVIDARDDYGLGKLTIVSWRASQTGQVGAPVRESLDVTSAGDRAIVQTELALEGRGLIPGDTLRFYVEAEDNAPRPRTGRSPEFALRLPSRAEMRAAARAAAAQVAAAADSVAEAQAELGDRTRDLAHERSREPATGAEQAREGAGRQQRQGALPFQATQRAEDVARQQAELAQRVDELSQAVEDIARAMEAAGLNDTAFMSRLREVQDLLERAITPEMAARLSELQEALQKLDPEATRHALERLAEAQRRLREELERSEELFRRAAMEGALASLAEDARDLRAEQQEWNAKEAPRADSAAAAAERALAQRADSLAASMARAQRDMAASRPPGSQPLDRPREAANRAGKAMRRAASSASEGQAQAALNAGEEAASELESLPEDLMRQRDSLAQQWRGETLQALDRAMSEAAALADRQQRVTEQLRRGDGGAGTRSQQAAVEEGTQAVERQIREAAGRNALVSPQLEGALNYAQRQMRASRQQLEQGTPNTGAAAQLADQALDALNATAHALARSRSAVAGSQSGSGMAEAIEQMARMAQAQQGLNADANGMMPGLAQGEGMAQQMRDLAGRQRQLAEQLERMRASGTGGGGAEAMAQEARDLARRLEAGRLDRQTVERQERLYRRLLDAGRTLSGNDPDEEKERQSHTAQGDARHRPPQLAPGATGPGARVRYPTWEELRALSPTDRKLVLEYFRQLNGPRE